MKNIIYNLASLVCLAIAMCACSNEEPAPAPSEELVHVTFKVNPFNVNVEPMNAPQTRATSELGGNVNEIIYLITNTATGKKWDGKQTLSTSGDEFGTLNLWMPEGTYNIHVAAANHPHIPSITAFNMLRDNNGRTELRTHGCDAFGLFKSFNITSTTQSVDLNLARCVGQIVLRLKDEIPAEVESINIQSTSYLACYPATGVFISHIDYVDFQPTISNGRMEEWSTFFIPQNNVNLAIAVYGEGGAEMGTSEISVNVYKNKRTIIEGNLTDIIQQRPLNIVIDDEWGDDVIVPL